MIHLTSRPLKPDALSKKLSRIGSKEQKHRNAHRITLAGVWFLTLVAIASLGLMTQLTLASGHAPKLKLASLVHFDTGNKYYTTMIEGIKHNFKQTIKKASQRLVSSMGNVTFSKPIRLVGPKSVDRPNKRQRVTIEDLQIEGINNPKVLSVHFDEQYLKLHVVFKLKSIRVSGRCVSRLSKKRAKQQLAIGQQPKQQQRQLLMEAKNWKAAWSASVMKIIGRDHFDSAGVHSSHSEPRKLSWNLNGCPEVFHEQLRLALIDRVRTSIDRRLIDIMETVMIPMDSAPIDDPVASLEDDKSRPVGKRGRDWDENQEAKPDFGQLANKRVDQLAERKWTQSSTRRLNPLLAYLSHSSYANGDDGDNGRHKPRRKSLRRTKRQAPCEQGEDLDDYVDQLFRFGTKIVQGMEPVSAPNTTIELPDYNLKIFLYDGKGTRFYKFKRAKSSWVYCSNETVSLGITIEVEEVRVAYKYRVISGTRLLFDGDLEARLSPRLQAQLSQAIQEEDSMERVQQRIDRIRIFRLGRVFVIIRGLGNLTQSLSMLINSYLNDNQQELQPLFRMIERDALPMLNKRLERVAVGILGGDF